jgi:hypothetical protein
MVCLITESCRDVVIYLLLSLYYAVPARGSTQGDKPPGQSIFVLLAFLVGNVDPISLPFPAARTHGYDYVLNVTDLSEDVH